MKSIYWLALILITYMLIGISYILLNPLWESPDEIHHYPMVNYLENNRLRLPSQAEGTVGLWQQEGNQPPLYYIIGTMLTAPLDTTDIDDVMRVNPHADIGIIRPDFNGNRLVHHPEREAFPSNGAVLATYILRFFSLTLGALTIFVTYHISLLVFPSRPSLAIGAAGINAFIPMYIYISASVNNDNLSNLLANLLVYMLLRLLLLPNQTTYRNYVLIGIITGLGLLSKLNIGLLIPFVALVLLVLSLRQRNWKPLVIGGIISGGITNIIAGWWYLRNIQLFGDPTGLSRFLEIVGQRAEPATLAQLWAERTSFVHTFWGLFGSITVPMPDSLYPIFNWVGGLALILGFITLLILLFKRDQQRIALLVVILWSPIVLIAVMRWSSITPASQGRLVYGSISVIVLLMASGIGYWLPKTLRQVGLGIIIIGMAVVSAIQPFYTIAPAYAKPQQLTQCQLDDDLQSTFQISDCDAVATFTAPAGQIAVLDSQLYTESVQVGDYLEFDVNFRVDQTFDTNWSIFVHVVSPEGIILAQRDVYPAGGRLATQDLIVGQAWQNHIAVLIPPTTYAPTTVEVRLGWYNIITGQRMTLADNTETLSLGIVGLLPQDLAINFGNQIELIGYDITSLSAEPTETIELTLYWRRLQPISQDYVVFANIIDPNTLTKFADSNAMPSNWTRPTSTWQPDEIITDTHTLTISPDAIAGDYLLEIGLYLQEDGFPRLPVIGTYDNFVYLTPIRIESEPTP